MASVSELFKKYAISKSTIYRWLKSGKIEGTKEGRTWSIVSDKVESWRLRSDLPSSPTVKTSVTATAPTAVAPAATKTTSAKERYAVGDVATRYKVSRSTIYRWLRSGKLEGAKEGRYWYITGKGEGGPTAPKGAPIKTTPATTALPKGLGGTSLQQRGFSAGLLSKAGAFGISHELIGKQAHWTPEFVTKGMGWGMQPSTPQGRSYWNAPLGMSAQEAFNKATGYVPEIPIPPGGGLKSGPYVPGQEPPPIPPGGGMQSGPVVRIPPGGTPSLYTPVSSKAIRIPAMPESPTGGSMAVPVPGAKAGGPEQVPKGYNVGVPIPSAKTVTPGAMFAGLSDLDLRDFMLQYGSRPGERNLALESGIVGEMRKRAGQPNAYGGVVAYMAKKPKI